MPNHLQRRSTGLDTLRALAIALVFTYHYMVFVSREPTFGWVSVVGWLGVDLFFVLSGYLIGNQLFAGMVRGEQLSLKNFYARRGLRTWPAFWVVLALYFLFPAVMGGKQPPPLWSFLTFTQNFGLQPGTAFSHAWSLCIEEQFYFVLPLFVLIALRVGGGRARAWMLLAALLAVGVISRAVLWSAYGREESGQIERYYPNVYYATLCRFDEFLPGIAVALLKNFHPGAWSRVQRHGQLLLLVGLAACGAIFYGAYNFYYIDGYGYGFFMSVFGYSLAAVAFSLLIIAAQSPVSLLARVRIPGAYHLALWSYSIYLTHKAVGHVFNGYAQAQSLSPTTTAVAVTLLSVMTGAALYWLIESPFMAVRDRYFPSTFAAKPLLPATARP
ncbi:acyltransferase [Ramlibacter sp. WS9]|uniref:acyltransferase family protein n=1 Tax=Ramlibacter sp. WS9 TaxID=1882741 RepID=UPI001144F4DE|nr:acyltransferase [Ramlibacter sp. WS9]ROZ69629.1 acyltransferase [Ramlibacter sp. WS9]